MTDRYQYTTCPPQRGVFCNRTLNLRSIRAIGYDMDYTLVQYDSAIWEELAYNHVKDFFLAKNWPVGDLKFDAQTVTRGLIMDIELGNLVKANRFGFIKRAVHGTVPMPWEEQRKTYARTVVQLSERRWVFMNTLFSLSEGCLFAQLVDLLDRQLIPDVMGYEELYRKLRAALDSIHAEGKLKAEILASPDRFVVKDPDVVTALLDQKHAGKKLLLITNSEWTYTVPMMAAAFDPFLPGGGWRDLFDVVIVGARKPEFFTTKSPLFEVVTEEGLLKPTVTGLRENAVFLGGSAANIEQYLGVSGYEILYVGDHMFGDVHVTKDVLRWRTALILRELEDEIREVRAFGETEAKLGSMMRQKDDLEAEACAIRLNVQRRREKYVPVPDDQRSIEDLTARLAEIRATLDELDLEISPIAKAANNVFNNNWGPIMRAGNDKSHLAYQMERYADIYTSRVSNLMYVTPFAFLRAPRGSLPHDPTAPGGKMDTTSKDNPIT